jgi:hypothetical protein
VSRLPGIIAPVALVAVWGGGLAAVVALHRRRPALPHPAAVVAVVLAAVAVVALAVYPPVDARRSSGGGSDADDAVLLVVDGMRSGHDPWAHETYLGNPITAGPGSGLWSLPWSTRRTYPIGIVVAVAGTAAVLRWATGSWREPAGWAVLLALSIPFWEGLAQGSDHLPFACSLVAVAAVVDRRPGPLGPRLAVLTGIGIGVLATARAVFGFVPALAAAARWRDDRRGALVLGGVGTAVVAGLHAWGLSRSGWDGYTPIQQLLVKSDEDLGTVGRLLVVLGAVAGVALVVRLLRSPTHPSAVALLLTGVGLPMVSIALAGLLRADGAASWSAGNYFLDTVALAAGWVASSTAPAPSRTEVAAAA